MQLDLSGSALANATKLYEAGRLQEAERACRDILAQTPSNADALQLLGLIAGQTGHLEHALTLFDLALAQRPDFAAVYGNRGIALMSLGREDEAGASLRRAVELRPDHLYSWYALGNALVGKGEREGAEAAFREALKLNPAFVEARSNLALALQHWGRTDEAIEEFERAIRDGPNHVALNYQLGVALHAVGRVEEAAGLYRRALELEPGHSLAASNLLLAVNYLPSFSREDLLNIHRSFDIGQAQALAPTSPSYANDRDPERKLRIGYASGDLRSHPVGFYLVGPLAARDPAAVEVFCYSNDPRQDELTEGFKRLSDNWRPVFGRSDEEVAALIRNDQIDILVDLSGHTEGGRPLLFARKPAPVQASWLGYPGTTGLSAMDYSVMDPSTAPEGAEAWFTEALARLPHGRFCYSPPAYAPDVAAPGERPLTFGSFSNLAKIGPEVVRVWARVLDAVPGSRLVLKWSALAQPKVRQRLADEFAAVGVGADRLELRGGSSHADWLAQYADIDIALDPFPFGGGLTSSEALWMGVPVVTLPLSRAASRQTLAFLHALGLDDLAAASEDDYVRIAAELAADPARRAELRQSLRERMATSPMNDPDTFAGALQAAYRQMWRRWCAGHSPAPITVA
jgi:protein O-GlcNAc transferase